MEHVNEQAEIEVEGQNVNVDNTGPYKTSIVYEIHPYPDVKLFNNTDEVEVIGSLFQQCKRQSIVGKKPFEKAFKEGHSGKGNTPECELVLHTMYFEYKLKLKHTLSISKLLKMDAEQRKPLQPEIANSKYYKDAMLNTGNKPYMIGLYTLFGGYYRNWYRLHKLQLGHPPGFNEQLINELVSFYFKLGIQENRLAQYPKAIDVYEQCKQRRGRHCSLLVTKEQFNYLTVASEF